MTYSSWFFYTGLVKRSRYGSQLCTGIWIRNLISLSSTTKCMFIIAVSTGISYFFDAKSWWCITSAVHWAMQGHSCSCVTWQGEQHKAYSSPNQVDREDYQWNLWRLKRNYLLTSSLLGKKKKFRALNPICALNKHCLKIVSKWGKKHTLLDSIRLRLWGLS